MLFEDDNFKMEIPLEEISGLESGDKTNESADKPAETTGKPAETTDKPAETGDKPKTSMQAQRIIEYIKENGFITTLIACEILKLKSSRAKEIIKTMVDKDIIIAVGESRARKYILKQAD